MRFYNYLSEMTLRGELTFGFELETIFTQKMSHKDMRQHIFDKLWGSKDYSLEEDQSIKVNDEDIETPVEFQSSPMSFTPQNIQKSIKFLYSLFSKKDFYTNSSCGFHVHFGMPKLDKFEMVWTYVNIAMDEELQNHMIKFKEYDFYDFEYADPTALKQINNLINRRRWNELHLFLDNEKHQIFRLHPQGTLEWRGPRNFLNKGTEDIKDFFMLLYQVISKFVRYRDSKEIKGYINRKEFEEIYKKSKLKFDTKDQKFDPRFDKDQDPTILSQIFKIAPWLNKAKFRNAIIEIERNNIKWINGIWDSGTWKRGIWNDGVWVNGIWENGIWEHGLWENGIWKDGHWFDGLWRNGTWIKGKWINGTWLSEKPKPS